MNIYVSYKYVDKVIVILITDKYGKICTKSVFMV